MWSQQPFIIVPFNAGWENALEAQRHFETRLGTGMFPWCLVPLSQCTNHLQSHTKQVPAQIVSNEEAKKIILERSVFDLVKNTQFLELTDSKLLGWYLRLPAEDRKLIQDEGGLLQFLQKHPALDVIRNFVCVKRPSLEEGTQPLSSAMSTDLNKSRRPTYYGVTLCKNCGISIPCSAKTCRLCCLPTKMPEEKLCLSAQVKGRGLLPAGLKEELTLPGEGPADGSLSTLAEESFRSACDSAAEGPPAQQGAHGSPAHILSQLWEEEVESGGGTVTVYKDPSAQASFALDAQLEQHGKTPQGIVGSHRAESTGLEAETLPEYCSFDTSYEDCSDTSQSGGSSRSGSDPAERGVAADSAPGRGGYEEWSRGERADGFGPREDSRFGRRSDEFHSVMEDAPLEARGATRVSTWTAALPGLEAGPQPGSRGADRTGPERASEPTSLDGSMAVLYDSRSVAESPQVTVSQAVDVSGDFRASYTSTRATEARWHVSARSCNTDPPHGTKNAGVNTGRPLSARDRGSQTTSAPTAEKCVVTELRMADLDFFTQEFIKLQHAQEELKEELKAKFACGAGRAAAGAGGGKGGACGCLSSQRAVRAELRLLALQRAMCQQHCWRHYYTSPEGDGSILSMEAPSENISSVLQHLEEDYGEMKRKILSGVPLDELRPLTVNSQKINSEAMYIPSEIIKDHLSEEEAPGAEQGGAQQVPPQDGGEQEGEGESGGAPSDRRTESVQTEQSEAPPEVQPRAGGCKSRGEDAPLPQQTLPPVGPSGPHPVTLPGTHRPGGSKDPDSSEAWYDAEEEFGPVPKGQKRSQEEGAEEGSDGTVNRGKKHLNCFLCVTGLPSDVTEDEVRSCFRKYQVSEVSITTFSKGFRVAMMTIGCPELAEVAVREVNGRTFWGSVVKVTRVCRPGNPLPKQPGGRAQSNRAGRVGNTQGPKTSKSSTSVTVKPLQQRLEKLTNVQARPTASGTCVPQHYGTMGSFDTLMARLTQRHPEAGRERIVQALVRLREQNQGLSGLPLKAIVDMTSDLLTRPPSPEVA
ncbi:RNA-binding protein 44 [Conger conger]|uniref:RNA-binding protein 44 n=1 Tax=Conger conger TaxID=82655 RepID=UPI002A5A46D8|nr:RNA-binding protein 44 [Conger conger]